MLVFDNKSGSWTAANMLEDQWGFHPHYSALEGKKKMESEALWARISCQDCEGGVRVINTTRNSILYFVLIMVFFFPVYFFLK